MVRRAGNLNEAKPRVIGFFTDEFSVERDIRLARQRVAKTFQLFGGGDDVHGEVIVRAGADGKGS